MKKSKTPESFIRPPGYPGGRKALSEFVEKNMQYPKEAMEKGIEGMVMVKFDINHKGKVIKAEVKNGLGYGCDEEALRLVKLMKYESKKHRGIRVIFHKTIIIHFNLKKYREKTHPSENESSGVQQIIYSYKEKESESKRQSYTFTIKLK
ncbi:MAG: energy transducer TonB [Bacteroidota bacterium]